MKTEQAEKNSISIIPLPVSIERGQGYVSIQGFQNLVLSPDNVKTRFVAEELKTLLNPVISITITKEPSESSGNLVLRINPSLNLKEEGYHFTISESQILMEAVSGAGLFYALQSFRQLLPPQLETGKVMEEIRLPIVEIHDYPRFGYRGMHLDVSRHFFPVEFIKTYLDMIVLHKMNIFHWHLTDDNGWRIEIDRYPELTTKSAWRVDREHEPWLKWSPIKEGEKPTYGGYYTKNDIREVIRYANERHITIIPEIEMPGHTIEVFAAYPGLSCKGDTLNVVPGSYWPNIDIFCAGNDEVFTFLENVLAEVIELFPGEYIHIGGDEADKTHWRTCPKCQQRIQDEGLVGEHELQSWFIRKIEKIILSKNRKLVGWDEILEGGLKSEATVMSWRSTKEGIEAAQNGHDVIMCPQSHCYFDYYQSDPETEPEAIGGFTTLKKVYSFNPVPEELNEEETKFILGAQGNLWTEYVKTYSRVQYRVLPRMTALSEVVWSPQKSQNYDDFYNRLIHLHERFDNLGWSTALGSFDVAIKAVGSGE